MDITYFRSEQRNKIGIAYSSGHMQTELRDHIKGQFAHIIGRINATHARNLELTADTGFSRNRQVLYVREHYRTIGKITIFHERSTGYTGGVAERATLYFNEFTKSQQPTNNQTRDFFLKYLR
jgi:hypothetical protein